jgi:O-antigen ligase
VAAKFLTWTSAVLLAAALVASQLLLGSWLYPALAAPGYLLAGLAAVFAGATFWKSSNAPGAWCVGSVLLFAGYLFWRQANSPDAYAASADTWLLLGGLACYLTTAWQLRGDGPRWMVLAPIFVLMLMQVGIVVAQFTADASFHPLADLALKVRLPDGNSDLPNQGFVTGTFASRGTLSAVLQSTTFLCLGLLVWGRGGAIVKMLLLWVTAAGLVGIVLCLSRAAYLGLTAGLVTFALVSFFILNRGTNVHRLWLGAGILLMALVPVALAASVGLESFLVRFRLGEIGGDVFREALWFRTVPPMLSLDPWFGVGANMFDQLSMRYRGSALDGRPIHAHNDWLQLLVEYGRIGLVLGVLCFAVHLAAGWRNALRLAGESRFTGLWPQATGLGLVSGALAALVAQSVHSFFDYRLHLAPVVFLAAASAGWLAGVRTDNDADSGQPSPWWMRLLAIMPAIPGALLFTWVLRELPAEKRALQIENAILRRDFSAAADLLDADPDEAPDNPRYLMLAAEAAWEQSTRAESLVDEVKWRGRCVAYWERYLPLRPWTVEAMRGYASVRAARGDLPTSLPFYLRGVALDPNSAPGYEYLAGYFMASKRYEEAVRLLRLSRTLPGAQWPAEKIVEIEDYLRASRP